MIALTICLFSSVVLAPFLEDLAARLSALTLKRRTASQVGDDFASIRQESFTSVSDFRKAFPLERLLIDKPKMFVRADLSGPFDKDTLRRRDQRADAVRTFIAHNYHQLDEAFAKMLRSTNDCFIAAVLSDPYGVADRDFLLPITELFMDYKRAEADLCIIDLLPDALRDPQVYYRIFSPKKLIKVVPNQTYGYTSVIVDPQLGLASDWQSHVMNRVISLCVNRRIANLPHDRKMEVVLVDTYTGRALSVNILFKLIPIFQLPGWLIIYNRDFHKLAIWRKDSKEPLVLKPFHDWAHLSTDGSRLVVTRHDGVRFTIPTDPSEPFEVTESVTPYEEAAVTNGMSIGRHLLYGRWATFFAPDSLERCRKFGEDLAERLPREPVILPIDLMMDPIAVTSTILAVSDFFNFICFKRYDRARYYAMALRTSFNLRNKEDFIFFIVAVLNGYRPSMLGSFEPQRLAPQSRLRDLETSLRFRTTVLIDSARRNIKLPCIDLDQPVLPRGLERFRRSL